MRRKRWIVGITILAGAAALVVDGQVRPLLDPGVTVRSTAFERYMGMEARFENGFHPEINVGQTSVRLYDSSGRLVRTNEVSLPGAERISLWDASVSKNGLVAVTATGVSSGGVEASVIVLFDRPDESRLIVRTNPFIADLVAIAPDGAIWVAGTDPKLEFGNHPEVTQKQKEELCVLQKYSPQGVLVGNFLRRSNYDAKVYPWTHTNSGSASLRASASGIGLYSPHADGTGEWVELSLAGDFKGRWTIAPPEEGLSIGAIGFTDSDSVYAQWVGGRPLPKPDVAYRLNKTTSSWDRVRDPEIQPPPPGRPARLHFAGTDGDLLVFITHFQQGHMAWFQEPPK